MCGWIFFWFVGWAIMWIGYISTNEDYYGPCEPSYPNHIFRRVPYWNSNMPVIFEVPFKFIASLYWPVMAVWAFGKFIVNDFKKWKESLDK